MAAWAWVARVEKYSYPVWLFGFDFLQLLQNNTIKWPIALEFDGKKEYMKFLYLLKQCCLSCFYLILEKL